MTPHVPSPRSGAPRSPGRTCLWPAAAPATPIPRLAASPSETQPTKLLCSLSPATCTRPAQYTRISHTELNPLQSYLCSSADKHSSSMNCHVLAMARPQFLCIPLQGKLVKITFNHRDFTSPGPQSAQPQGPSTKHYWVHTPPS